MILIDELKAIWEEIKKAFVVTYTSSIVDLWFEPLELDRYELDVIFFTTDNPIKFRVINQKYKKILAEAFSAFLGFEVDVALELIEVKDGIKRPIAALIPRDEEIIPKADRPVEASEFGTESFPFRFEYTFDNFIVGSSNRFAHAACLGVAENPACIEALRKGDHMSSYNPLFIYGPSGIGKTHLLHAIVNHIKAKLPEVKILYIRGDDFINQMIDHLAQKTMNEFKNKYRKCDVLLIDDIQFIAGKTSTQEEFFHTFNALYEDHKQIILTSDRPPREIKPLEDRLVTRFEWGILADIQPPDYELRVAIIKKKAEQVNLNMPEDVLQFLADNLRSNIRQIEGAIKKLSAMSFLTGSVVSRELAQQCITELVGGMEPVRDTVDRVFRVIQRHYGVGKEDLLSDKRLREIVMARHAAIYLIKNITGMSYPNLAKVFHKKNHTTMLSSYTFIQTKMRNEPSFAVEMDNLEKEATERF